MVVYVYLYETAARKPPADFRLKHCWDHPGEITPDASWLMHRGGEFVNSWRRNHGGIMEEESLKRTQGGGFMKERQTWWRIREEELWRGRGGGIAEVQSWSRNSERRGLMEEESWRRDHGGNHGGGIRGGMMEEESWSEESCRRKHGGRNTEEESGRHVVAS